MDEQLDIYVNVEEPPGKHGTRKREIEKSENIYENVRIHSLEPNSTERARSGAEDVKKSFCRAAVVCLALLCLLLLIGLITSVCLVTKGNSEREKMMFLLQNINNLTKERDQLQTSYNNLTEEKDQLQTSYNTLTEEKDQLQTSYNTLTEEKDKLQKGFDALTKERNDLQRELQAVKTNHSIALKEVPALTTRRQ